MYKDLFNKDVEVVVSSRGEMLLEYTGVLVDEDETSIKLKDVNISTACLVFKRVCLVILILIKIMYLKLLLVKVL